MMGGCERSSRSVAHGATDSGRIFAPRRSNVTGPTWPPVCVTNASTRGDTSRHEGWPRTVFKGAVGRADRRRRGRVGMRSISTTAPGTPQALLLVGWALSRSVALLLNRRVRMFGTFRTIYFSLRCCPRRPPASSGSTPPEPGPPEPVARAGRQPRLRAGDALLHLEPVPQGLPLFPHGL